MKAKHLAVVGAGPKSAAIAAKAWCLRKTGIPVQVSVFERDRPGAAWTGKHGYTDGDQRLCTPAERDFGYPYGDALGDEIPQLMQAHFSWQAFKTSLGGARAYSDWVSRGRKPPTHAELTSYIEYTLKRSEADIELGEVVELIPSGGRWAIVQDDGSRRYVTPGFNGVVVTGPGPASARIPKDAHPRIVDGVSFWQNRIALNSALRTRNGNICIVGGGGTAAAIAAWLVRNDCGHEILLLTPQATLFTRTANFFENRLFDDETLWNSIGPDQRREFATRLNRGVVWETVTDLLTDAGRLQIVYGSAQSIRRTGSGVNDIIVQHRNSLGSTSLAAHVVIDASGFDAWWFLSLLPDAIKSRIQNRKEALVRSMRSDLSLRIKGPRLHAPILSQTVGPGFSSLMVLGAMSDRILVPYL